MNYQTMGLSSSHWAGNSYREVKELGARDGSILVVPIGSLEQHGYHLPTGTDTILVDAVATETVEGLDDEVPLLITPPIWTGYSPHHMSFGGTVTVAFETLLALVEDVARSALSNGFDKVLFVNGHGGNRPLVSTAVQTVGTEHPEIEVLGLSYFELGHYFLSELRESDLGGIAHGGELETSLMLHLRPDLVDEEALVGTNWDVPYERYTANDLVGSGVLSVNLDLSTDTKSGTLGDPTLASAEKGEVMFDAYVEEFQSLIETIHHDNR